MAREASAELVYCFSYVVGFAVFALQHVQTFLSGACVVAFYGISYISVGRGDCFAGDL